MSSKNERIILIVAVVMLLTSYAACMVGLGIQTSIG